MKLRGRCYSPITGRRPIDRNRPKSEQELLEWVKPYISDVKRFPIIVDPRLEGHYDLRSMTKLASVANRCLVRMPKMSEVYGRVQKIVDSIETGPPLHYQMEEEVGDRFYPMLPVPVSLLTPLKSG
jgi:hypothetical protein